MDKIKETLPSQILDIPFTLTGGCNIPMNFYAGFLGMKQDEKTQQVTSVIGSILTKIMEKTRNKKLCLFIIIDLRGNIKFKYS